MRQHKSRQRGAMAAVVFLFALLRIAYAPPFATTTTITRTDDHDDKNYNYNYNNDNNDNNNNNNNNNHSKHTFSPEHINWTVPAPCGYFKCFFHGISLEQHHHNDDENVDVGYLVMNDDDNHIPYSQTLHAQYEASHYLVQHYPGLLHLYLDDEPPRRFDLLSGSTHNEQFLHRLNAHTVRESYLVAGQKETINNKNKVLLGTSLWVQKVRVAPPSVHFGCLRQKARQAVQDLPAFVKTHVMGRNGGAAALATGNNTNATTMHTSADHQHAAHHYFVNKTRHNIQLQLHMLQREPRFAFDYQLLLDAQGNLWQIDLAPSTSWDKDSTPTTPTHDDVQNKNMCIKHLRIFQQEILRITKAYELEEKNSRVLQ